MSAPMSARHDGRYLGDGRLLRPDRQELPLSGGVGIGGVLEPLQAEPVIIEDDCFIGARSEVVEGVIVEQGAVLAMGTFISATTKIVDRDTGEIHLRPRAGLFGRRARLASRQAPARRQPRPEPLLRRHRQAGRRADPCQDRDQRTPARMMDEPLDPVDARRRADPPAERHAEGRAALRHRRRARRPLGFTCHRLTLRATAATPSPTSTPAAAPARRICASAGHTDVVPTGAPRCLVVRPVRRRAARTAACAVAARVDMKGAIAAFVARAGAVPRRAGPERRIDQPPDHRRRGGSGDQRHPRCSNGSPRAARRSTPALSASRPRPTSAT